MEKNWICILLCSLLLTACDYGNLNRYIYRSNKDFVVYQYKTEMYFDYISMNGNSKEFDYIEFPHIVPIEDSENPFWLTHDCGKHGKYVPIKGGYNPAAIDTLSFCEFLEKEIFRLDNNCFIEPYLFLHTTYGPCFKKIYNVKRTDYCKSYDMDSVKCIEENPFSKVFYIPYTVIEEGTGETTPTFKEIIKYLNTCINDSSIYNYEKIDLHY